MLMPRIFVYLNALLSAALVVGLMAASLMPAKSTNRVTVPASFSWAAPTEQSVDAFANDGAQLSSDALDSEEDVGPHPASRQARGLIALDRINDAISLLEGSLRKEPREDGLHNALGNALLKAERNAEAVASFSTAISLASGEPRYHYNRATALLRDTRYDEAISSFQDALALNPFHAASRYNLALAYGRSGNSDAAEGEYRKLLESDRGATGASARFNLGVMLMQAGRVDEAVDEFTLLLRSQPSHVDARFNRALLLARMGSIHEASEQYRRVLDIRPEHFRARLNLAALYMKADDCASATIQLNQLVTRSPSYALAHYNLGVCELRSQQPNSAIPHLMKATSLDPKLGEAHYNLALAFARVEDHKAALKSYSTAVATSPGVASYHYNYALALNTVGRFDEAIAQYQAALRLELTYFEARYNLGLVHFHMEDFEAAQHVFESALKQRPDSYESAYNLGLTLLKLNSVSRAETILRRALALEETLAAHYNLGLAMGRQGRYAEANEHYEAALRIDPKHARSIERLAEGKLELGEHDAALTRLEQLGRIQPDDPTALNSGIRLLRRDQFALAERYLEVAAKSKNSVSARYNMGLAIARQGRHQEATKQFAAALELDPLHTRSLERLAETYIQLGTHDEAIAALERLVPLAPKDPTALNAGIRLLNANEAPLAKRYFEVSAKGDTRLRARSLDLIGRALTGLDRDAALAHLRDAAREFPDNAAIAEQLRLLEAAKEGPSNAN